MPRAGGPQRPPGRAPRGPCPLMVVSGFLGAGKTTLLTRVLGLAGAAGLKVAALVNEVAELDIDSELLAAAEREDAHAAGGGSGRTVRLANGCVCCSIRDELGKAVHDLLVWEEPEYVLLETSGVTDPEALLATLREEPLRGLCFLDSVVTVVDAAHFRAAFARSRSMVGQVRAADVVLLNKVDLAAEAQRDATIRAVQDIQPGARILPCVRACVSLPLIMGLHLAGPPATAAAAEGRPQAGEVGEAGEGGHLAADGISTVTFTSARPLARAAFQAFLAGLPEQVVRAKGFVGFAGAAGEPASTLVQLCGRRYEATLSAGAGAGRSQVRLAMIGEGLEGLGLREALAACVAAEEEEGEEGAEVAAEDGAAARRTAELEAEAFLRRVEEDPRLDALPRPGPPGHVGFTVRGTFGLLGKMRSDLHAAALQRLIGSLAAHGVFLTPCAAGGRLGAAYAFGGGGASAAEVWGALGRELIDALSWGVAQLNVQTADPGATVADSDLETLHRFHAMRGLMLRGGS